MADLIAFGLRQYPEAAAVEFQGSGHTREEIRLRSDRLAFWLLRHGVGCGSLVGIFMERSVEMLVAILAVLKSGAAYVPLDPAFPLSRTEGLLSETKLAVLLTLAGQNHSPPRGAERVFALERSPGHLADEAPTALPHIAPEELAYVIFTSGSTGKPKGVEITHAGVVNLLLACQNRLEIVPGDRFLAVTTLMFDISVLELLLPIAAGGTVVLATTRDARDGARLRQMIRETDSTVLQATPFTWRLLLSAGFEPAPGFKMLCGGEAWLPSLAHSLLRTGGRLWNMYGPTETTVWSSATEVMPGSEIITIGQPIANTRFYVLDENLEPVTSGSEGELYIAGLGLARGYLGRPDLSAERFVPDIRVPGERMYRTGDHVRTLPEGRMIFLGRGDQQIKFRGYRIELGEIEAAVCSMRGVSDAVAVLLQDQQGEDMLACFYLASEAGDGPSELRQRLRGCLPAYMVPQAFRKLESFPLTDNGKTDRKALLRPEWLSSVEAAILSEPMDGRTPDAGSVRQAILNFWQQLFPGETITPESDFFDLGGDSLLVLRLQSLVEKRFGVMLTLADVYRHSRLNGFSAWVQATTNASESEETHTQHSRLVPLRNGDGKETPIFLMPHVLLFENLAAAFGTRQPVYALELLESDISAELEHASFSQLAQVYCKIIRDVQRHGPYKLGGWCMWGWMAYEVARLLEQEGETLDYVLVMDTEAPGHGDDRSAIYKLSIYLAQRWYRTRWLLVRLWHSDMHGRRADISRRLRNAFQTVKEAATGQRGPKTRVQRTLSRAAQSYTGGSLNAEVIVIKGDHRPTGPLFEQDLGWSKLVGHPVHVNTVRGNHSEVFDASGSKMIAERIREVLTRSRKLVS